MLQALNRGSKAGIIKFVLLGFMVMAVAGLVMMDVGGFFRGDSVSSNVVAKGSGVSITTREFDLTVRRVLSRQNIGPAEAYKLGLVHTILNAEIQQRLLSKKAHDLGLRAGDDLVREQMAKLAEPLAAEGQSKTEALKQVLRSQGISEKDFIASIRQETANSVLRNALVAGAGAIPAPMARDIYRAENQTRDVEALVFTHESIADVGLPTDENLEKYYEANKADYAVPETRTVTLATLKRDMLESKVEISEEELREDYDNNIASYSKPERRSLRQAVVADAAVADKIAARVREGKTLKEAVAAVTGSEDAYLGEEAFQESGLLEEISTPVFKAKENDVIGPVQTALGWHVLRLTKILPPDVEPFEAVKEDIREEILQTRLMDDLLAAGNEIDDRLASGEELESIVKEMGLTTQSFGPFRASGMDDKGEDVLKAYQGDRAQIIDAAFAAAEGETAPVIETADGQFIAVRVDSARPLEYKPLEAVRRELEKKWLDEQRSLMNKSRAQEAHKKLEDGAALADVAREYGVKPKTFNNLKRGGDAPKEIGAIALERVFTVDRNAYILAETPDGVAVAAVTAIDFPASETVKQAEIDALQDTLKRDQAMETIALYTAALAGQSKIKINEGVLKRMYADSGS